MQKFQKLTDGMMVVNISESEGGYNYFGYIRHNGEWVIMRENVAETEFLFTIGANNYSTKWSGRTSLNYNLPIIG